MKRWLLWFLLAPQTFLLAGLWHDVGLPAFEIGALACLHLALFAERRSVPWLLLGLAMGRALVDDASLPIHLLVLGIPVAVLLPLRTVLPGAWLPLQVAVALLYAVAIPKLSLLLGVVFAQPTAAGRLDGGVVAWSAVLVPALLVGLRRLPPWAAFEEVR
ncbi:MAG: hypothetical protein JNK15_09260 [Planctomycetes bacterium]|nr:hypothetical protein [Planctomycetota bacterium]